MNELELEEEPGAEEQPLHHLHDFSHSAAAADPAAEAHSFPESFHQPAVSSGVWIPTAH
jgi:hypothetical protein